MLTQKKSLRVDKPKQNKQPAYEFYWGNIRVGHRPSSINELMQQKPNKSNHYDRSNWFAY